MSQASDTIDLIEDDSTRPVILSRSMTPTTATQFKPQTIDHHKSVSCPPSRVVSPSRPYIASKAARHYFRPRRLPAAESGNCPVLFDEVHECGCVVFG